MNTALSRLPAIVTVVGVLSLAACSEQQAPPPAPQAPQVTVAKPISRNITDYDEYVGRFAAVDLINMYARVSGYLASINFTDGQLVNKGDLLFTIDKRPFQIALDQAEANLAKAQADVDFSTSDLQRAQTLLQDKTSTAISKQTFDQRLQTERAAHAAAAGAEAAVQAAKLDLEFTDLRAPVTGRIGDRKVAVGNLVTGGSGGTNTNTLLATIVSIDPIYFEFTYDEASYLRYQRMAKEMGDAGQSIPVRLELIDEKGFPHKGVLDFVDNKISETTGTIRGRAQFANPDSVFTPGMFGRIQVPTSAEHPALTVPDVAIATEQTRKFVYVLQPGDAPQVPTMKYVTLGRVYDGQRVIDSGLDKDDLVVVNGLSRIRPGAKVVGKLEAPAAPAASAGTATPAAPAKPATPAAGTAPAKPAN
ncbi:efflux RND transporter periplasmic adaptor subunit [Ancylobacter pratisalsi]|uniref:Efflux RND transporter periplasmic adaptor subunit n=1 Tax=Ancylobacter pratisalsi TaxID=1745854 RepID=A0A6P1YPJ5_9HYPH|nr:efflux RND transporter periplasmic adaptor subunit [Ancylobacter pratisalsi]QIB35397.1 efflux RND transporter periplasmic adaptor subunit [Ancylobacter pratisalsi]